MGRRCCWRSRAWAAKGRKLGARFLTNSLSAALRRPEFLIVNGAPGLEKAIAAVWHGVPVQRCTVHKHRNLLAHAPDRPHEEISADYTDMIYAATPEEIETRRKAFIRKRRLKHRAVADSLEEAGEQLFTFTRQPPSQWKSARTTNAIERLHEEFKRRIKTQTVPPSAETAACYSGHYWLPVRSACGKLMAGRRSPTGRTASQLTLPRDQITSTLLEIAPSNSNHNSDGTHQAELYYKRRIRHTRDSSRLTAKNSGVCGHYLRRKQKNDTRLLLRSEGRSIATRAAISLMNASYLGALGATRRG